MIFKKQYKQFAQDAIANRVYQAYERLQLAWYSVNARRAANSESFDEAAIMELNAAEEEWLAARASVSINC